MQSPPLSRPPSDVQPDALALVFEDHPDPMWVCDVETLRFLAVNRAALEKYGYDRSEFLALRLEDIRPGEEVVPWSEAMAAVMQEGASHAGLFEHRTRDGARIRVEVRSSSIRYEGRPARLVLARDLSRLLALEAERTALLERERQSRREAEAAASHFRSLFEAAPGSFLVLDSADYRIVAASDAYLAATMTRREQIQGRPMFEVFPDDPADPRADGVRNLRRSLDRVRDTGMADVMALQRYPIRRGDGQGFEERYWSAVNTPVRGHDGGLAYIIHRVEDVTSFVLAAEGAPAHDGLRPLEDRANHLQLDILLRSLELKEANVQLARRDATLRIAQRLVSMASWELEPATGALRWSDHVYAICGVQPDSFGPSFDAYLDLVHPDDRAHLRRRQADALLRGRPMDLVHRIVRPDGAVRFVREAAELVDTADGPLLVGVIQDVTAERLAAAEAAAAFDLLGIAGRVARLGGWRFDAEASRLHWSPEMCAIHEIRVADTPSVDEGMAFYLPEDRERIRAAFLRCLQDGTAFDELARIQTRGGALLWVRAIGEADRDDHGRIRGARGAFQDISELVAARERSEHLLRRLRDTLESITDAFLVLDADDRFSFVNSKAEQLLQRSRADLLGREAWTEFPAADPVLRATFAQAVRDGQAVEVEHFSQQRGLWFHVKAYPTRDGLAVYFRDVTQQRRTQDELLLLQSAIARQNDILLITEAEPIDAPHGPRIVYVNDAFVRRTGYSREQALGRTPRLLQGPATDRAELDRIRAALENRTPVRAELVNYTREGQPFWLELDIAPILDAAGAPTHWVAVERDVTERKDAERRARLNEERFQLLARATNDVIWDWDLASDEIWWNDAFETLFGYDRSRVERSSASWTSRIHPDDRERVVSGIHAVLQGRASHWTDEYRFLGAHGEVLDVIDRGFAIRNEAGVAVRMIGSMIDVTGMRWLEAQLRQSQRLDAIGQLTGGVAHDFNNLLTVILGNAEVLADELAGTPHLAQLAETTVHAATRAAELTSRLLAFARKQALNPRPTDVNALLQRMEGLLSRTLGEHIETRLLPGTALWQAHVDAAQLEAALLNLCINARDAMPAGGQLVITTSNATVAGDNDDAAELLAGEYVMLAVSDTGCGMEAATLARAFEPFFTTKDVGKGSGLGLSMVYGFAKQSKGHVRINSSPGRGTTVRLYLPRETVPVAPASALEAPPLRTGRERILLVEDNDLVRQHVEAQLASLGYQVRGVARAEDALSALRAAPFDLLFTDIVMPGGMNGRELAEAAQVLDPALAVLFTSGYARNALRDATGLPPGVHLLAKPYRRPELAAKVRLVLDDGAARRKGTPALQQDLRGRQE